LGYHVPDPLGRLGLLLRAAVVLLVAAYVAPVFLFLLLYWPPRGSPPFSLAWVVAWTVGQAALSATAAVAAGWPLGVLAGFYRCRAAAAAAVLGLGPFMSPVVAAALGLRGLYRGTPFSFLARGWTGVVALNSYFNIGFAAALVAASARETEASMVEHARLLGLRGPRLWLRVLLPLTGRAAAYAWAVAFLYSATSASPLLVEGAAYRYYTLEAWLYSLYIGFPSLRGLTAALAAAEYLAAAAASAALLHTVLRVEASPLAARGGSLLPLRGAARAAALAYSVLVVLYLYAPLAALAVDARGASLQGLDEAARGLGPGLWRALANSAAYAAATVAAAVPLGLAAARSRLLSTAALSSIAVAPIAYGVAATLVYYSGLEGLLGPAGASVALILLAHAAAALPLSSRALDLAAARLPREVVEEMMLLGLRGAGFIRAWLGAAAPAAWAAAALAAAASLGEFGATLVVSNPDTWSLTVLVYQLMGSGRLFHEACLAALILEAASMALLVAAALAAQRLTRRV
jgi:thiamine transport system permease protein